MYLRSVTVTGQETMDTREYPFSVPVIQSLQALRFNANVTFFVGENGSGKSTLLEAIAYQCGFNSAGGGRNNVFDADASASRLGEHIRLAWLPKITSGFFLRAETFHHFASHLDAMPGGVNAYGGRSLHAQSHGEAFLSLFNHRFGRKAIYLLDEPEAALSPARQLALMRIMHDLGDDAQFIVATHSPILLGYPGAQIYDFDTVPVAETRYEETLHYIVTRRFMDNRARVLEELFGDE